MTDVSTTSARVTPTPGRRTTWGPAIGTVYRSQLARTRVSRGPLLFVATLQSVGILVLLRGIVHDHDRTTQSAVVAGASVLVVAFVGLNLLAQRFGMLRSTRALDYYAALPIPLGAVVLGTAASYATFTVPGAVATAAIGVGVYSLPAAHLWLVLPVVVASGLALAGCGAALGLLMPRPELATVAGQLGMTLVLFLDVIPPSHLPAAARVARAVVPSTLAVDAFAAALRGPVDATATAWRLGVTCAIGVVTLAIAAAALRRAVRR